MGKESLRSGEFEVRIIGDPAEVATWIDSQVSPMDHSPFTAVPLLQLRKCTLFCLQTADSLVGYVAVAYVPLSALSGGDKKTTPTEGYIVSVLTVVEQRRKGIARLLLQEAIHYSAHQRCTKRMKLHALLPKCKLDGVASESDKENRENSATQLYTSLGFAERRRIADYYGTGLDASELVLTDMPTEVAKEVDRKNVQSAVDRLGVKRRREEA